MVLGETKTQEAAVPGSWLEPATEGRADIPRYAAPGAAADHAPGAITILLLSPGRTIRGRTDVIRMPTVLRPFHNVAEHVMKTPLIRPEAPDRGNCREVILASVGVQFPSHAFVDLSFVLAIKNVRIMAGFG